MFAGTLTNVITVVVGTALGVGIGSRIPERMRQIITASLGLLTAGLAVRETITTDRYVLVLVAVLAGSIIGELLRIEQGLERLGLWLQGKLSRTAPPSGRPIDVELPESTKPEALVAGPNRFAEGFVIASLVFCIGPLTILGSINDGLGDPELLIVKAGLDGFASIAFAAIYGWGVGLAALTVLVVQGSIALLASGLEGVLSDPMIDALASAGGILLFGIALRLLEIKHIRVANMLPALVLAPFLVWLFP